ncbi:hypothetical protein VN12_21475 [Pirellula sp. SH-Sr6A]|nr:hypothetical protein VN12_21475 [Pirellula sp. SH-Sr6A]
MLCRSLPWRALRRGAPLLQASKFLAKAPRRKRKEWGGEGVDGRPLGERCALARNLPFLQHEPTKKAKQFTLGFFRLFDRVSQTDYLARVRALVAPLADLLSFTTLVDAGAGGLRRAA